MEKCIILSKKTWNKDLAALLTEAKSNIEWILINDERDFSFENLKKISPEYIFIPHWSDYIPENIYQNFRCIIFHETDVPFGRGGSPIQNLIERGFTETQITALKATKQFDAGDVYMKRPLSLHGSAEEIFIRANLVIKDMIIDIVENNPEPVPQEGTSTVFKRRKPEEGNLAEIDDLKKIYDFIRMLDAEGYPNAFLETEYFRFEFSRASLKANKSINADVRIIKK